MNLRDLFDLSFVNRRDQAALEWAGATYTFGDVDQRSNRMAQALAGRGLAQGDRLCVYLANRIEMIDLYLACIKLGVIFVPINILYREREISHIVSDAEPKLLITERELHDLVGTAVTPPAILLARFLRTIISRPTRSTFSPGGKLRNTIDSCSLCRCFTFTRSATACTAG